MVSSSMVMTRSIAAVAVSGAALTLLGCAARTQAPSAGLVVSDVTVVSPERAAPLEHAYVRILGTRIAEVSTRPLRGEREIAGNGRYLVPGLIDSHVHLALPPGFPAPMSKEQAAAHPEIVAAALAQDPRSFLYFGFTTVLDLVGTAERTAQWNARELRPDAYYCGAAVILEGRVREVLYPYFSYGLPWEKRMAPVTDPARQTPEAVVARMAADGAICVKTVHDVGMTPTVEEVRGLVAAAHARNMPVLIHANRRTSQALAVAAGVDVVVHGMWRNPGEEVALDEEAQRVLAAIARDRIGYHPTTQVIAGFVDMHRADYLSRTDLADAYPAVLIDLYRSQEGAAGVPDSIKNANAEAVANARDTVDRAAEVTRILAAADARLLFGTDTPSDLIYTNPPGLNGRLEMNHWIAGGVSEEKLFRALTIDNARMMRLDDEIGTVEPGKTANLLLLRANPLETVSAYDTIETVILHGRPIPRAELSARRAGE
jgi:imidazolonepropionase-like amidohydrolase